MNVLAAKEAARVYFDYEPGERWDEVWANQFSDEGHRLWYDIAKAIEHLCEPETASERNTGPVVDADARAIIVSLQAEVARLSERLAVVEAWTRPLGSAKVLGEELLSGGKTVLDLTGIAIKAAGKKGN